jgi:hypothetical protein
MTTGTGRSRPKRSSTSATSVQWAGTNGSTGSSYLIKAPPICASDSALVASGAEK